VGFALSAFFWIPALLEKKHALVDSILLLIYSAFVKRKSGFAANVLVGLLVGTAFLYGEATILNTVSLVSLSLYPIACGTIGGNILRDIFSLEGDSKTD